MFNFKYSSHYYHSAIDTLYLRENLSKGCLISPHKCNINKVSIDYQRRFISWVFLTEAPSIFHMMLPCSCWQTKQISRAKQVCCSPALRKLISMGNIYIHIFTRNLFQALNAPIVHMLSDMIMQKCQ